MVIHIKTRHIKNKITVLNSGLLATFMTFLDLFCFNFFESR